MKKGSFKINETPVDLGSLFPTYVMFKELQNKISDIYLQATDQMNYSEVIKESTNMILN